MVFSSNVELIYDKIMNKQVKWNFLRTYLFVHVFCPSENLKKSLLDRFCSRGSNRNSRNEQPAIIQRNFMDLRSVDFHLSSRSILEGSPCDQ